MAAVKGYIEKIKYRNEDNGYTVLSISGLDDGEEYVLVGTFLFLSVSTRDKRDEIIFLLQVIPAERSTHVKGICNPSSRIQRI